MEQSDRDRLDELFAAPEGRQLEFKEAGGAQFSFDKVAEYCVALANEGGGSLFLGVTDRVPRQVTGTTVFPNLEDTEHSLHQKINHRVVATEWRYDDQRIIEFRVGSRLSGNPVAYKGKYLMRQGESLVPMTQDELRSVFAETRGHYLALPATQPLPRLAALALLEYETFFTLLGAPLPTSVEKVAHALAVEGLIHEVDDGRVRVTNLGAVLLAKDLRAFGPLQYHRIRFLRYAGTNNIDATLDHFEYRGYAVAFEQLTAFVQGYVPTNERIVESFRQSMPLYPAVAIREFLANALIHQDFESAGGSVTIEMFDDRLQITNPGRPVIDVRRFVDETKSRNAMMSDLMRRLGICEVRGSGIDRVLAQLEAYQQPAPRFEVRSESTQVMMRAHEKFSDMTPDERAWATYLHCALQWVSNDRLTNSSLRARFGLPKDKTVLVSQAIARAVALGYIRSDVAPESGTRSARYVPDFA